MPSRIVDYPIFDADNHMYEAPEALTKAKIMGGNLGGLMNVPVPA